MHRLIWLGAAAVGASLLLSREPGRRWLREGYENLRLRVGRQSRLDRWVEETANRVHPDTVMAQAFDEAVHAR